jgi:hypothetical protein
MPTPIFNIYSPGINETAESKIKSLLNAYTENTQQLQWLLSHLDEKNVLRAKRAIIAEIFAGTITTDQLIAGDVLIQNALIDSLSATKITAGTMTIAEDLFIQNADGSIVINGSLIDITDGKIRIKDSSGNSIILDQFGLDTKFIKWFKNMCYNSSFEVFDSTTLIPTYWDGGVSSPDSNFFETYSLKLTPAQSSKQTGSGIVNPQWYNSVSTKTRVSFHKKGGKVKIYVLDGDSADSAFTLTDEAGNTGTFIEYAANYNWVPESYTVSLTHGTSTKIKVRFENTDASADAYIDGVIIEPDYTGKRPSFYTDGPFSEGVGNGQTVINTVQSRLTQSGIANGAEVVVQTTDIELCSIDLSLDVDSKITVTANVYGIPSDALRHTLTIKLDSVTQKTAQKPFYSTEQDEQTLIHEGITVKSGNHTITLYGKCDEGSFTVATKKAAMLVDYSSSVYLGLIAFYELDDNSDNGGSGLDLTSYGTITHSAGKVGNCAYFNGASWLYIQNNLLAEILWDKKPYTVVGWFKTTQTHHNSIVAMNDGGLFYDTFKVGMNDPHISPNGRVNFNRENGTESSYLSTAHIYNDGNWHMFVAEFDGSSIVLNMDNGAEIVSNNSALSVMHSSSIRIGSTDFPF